MIIAPAKTRKRQWLPEACTLIWDVGCEIHTLGSGSHQRSHKEAGYMFVVITRFPSRKPLAIPNRPMGSAGPIAGFARDGPDLSVGSLRRVKGSLRRFPPLTRLRDLPLDRREASIYAPCTFPLSSFLYRLSSKTTPPPYPDRCDLHSRATLPTALFSAIHSS